MNKCQNCAKQYFCELVNSLSETSQECKQVKWRETKNYGEVTKIENTRDIHKKQ